MNAPDQPLSPDALDELLSADIDGELDRAAAELGFTPATARAAVDAAPEAGARRAALVRARELLATGPALDAASEGKLIAAALARPADELGVARARKHRFEDSWRVLVAVGSAAAIVAGIVVVSAKSPGTGAKSTAASAKLASPPTGGKPLSVAFGDVTDSGSLRRKVQAGLHVAEAAGAAGEAINKNLKGAGSASGPVAFGDSTGAVGVTGPQGLASDLAVGAPSKRTCIGAVKRADQLRSGPLLAGTGSSAGRRVFVAVFRRGAAAYDVFVLSATDCSVVMRSTLP